MASIAAACVALAGCAATEQAVRPESGEGAVRIPAARTFELQRRRESPYPPAAPPFFEDDEYRYSGRWLTLFEIDFNAGPPAAAAPVEEK